MPHVLAELLQPLRLLHQHVDRGHRAVAHGRRQRVAEELRARLLHEVIADDLGRRDVAAARAAQRLAHRAGLDRADVLDAEMLGGAAAGLAEHAGGVRLVDDEDRVVLVRQLFEGGQVGHIAFHAEHAVGDDELIAGGLALGRVEHPRQLGQVAVLVDEPLGLAQADRVDDRGVVEGVGEDRVLRRGGQRGHHAHVRVPATDEGRRGLAADERADFPLQLEVAGHRPADEADGGGAHAELLDGIAGGGEHLGVVGQTEVVVGGQHDDVVAVHPRARRLRPLQLVVLLVLPGVAQLLKLPGERFFQRRLHVLLPSGFRGAEL